MTNNQQSKLDDLIIQNNKNESKNGPAIAYRVRGQNNIPQASNSKVHTSNDNNNHNNNNSNHNNNNNNSNNNMNNNGLNGSVNSSGGWMHLQQSSDDVDDEERIRKELKKTKEEIKQKVKEEKLKVKEEKLKVKEEKIKAKGEIKTKSIKKQDNNFSDTSENIILGPSIVIDTLDKNELCIEIIKSGIKKGSQCTCKKIKDDLCKRHFNLKKNKGIIYL
jgi:hypothetical protein